METPDRPPSTVEVEDLYRKVSRRAASPLILLYFIAFLGRINISFAAASMNRDLGNSDHVYGLSAGVFFLGYLLLGVPRSVGLRRFGPRTWLSLLMVSWGLVSLAFAFVRSAEVYALVATSVVLGLSAVATSAGGVSRFVAKEAA